MVAKIPFNFWRLTALQPSRFHGNQLDLIIKAYYTLRMNLLNYAQIGSELIVKDTLINFE